MCCFLFLLFFFFFFSSRRRHTRLTCDWSSDVCSSDLFSVSFANARDCERQDFRKRVALPSVDLSRSHGGPNQQFRLFLTRSEERRVGKECRSRWGRDR